MEGSGTCERLKIVSTLRAYWIKGVDLRIRLLWSSGEADSKMGKLYLSALKESRQELQNDPKGRVALEIAEDIVLRDISLSEAARRHDMTKHAVASAYTDFLFYVGLKAGEDPMGNTFHFLDREPTEKRFHTLFDQRRKHPRRGGLL